MGKKPFLGPLFWGGQNLGSFDEGGQFKINFLRILGKLEKRKKKKASYPRKMNE